MLCSVVRALIQRYFDPCRPVVRSQEATVAGERDFLLRNGQLQIFPERGDLDGDGM
jgi:hypothetical protein